MRRKHFLAALLLTIVLGFSYQAVAADYTISYFYVQHRLFEDGKSFNRFYVEFKDTAGNYVVPDETPVLALYDKDDNLVAIQDLAFTTDKNLDGQYDGANGRWMYGKLYEAPYYYGTIDGTLTVGTYKLEASAVFEGVPIELKSSYDFNGQVDLPITPSKKIKPKFDKAGNLTCEWPVPYGLWTSQPQLQTSVRAEISVYDGSTYLGAMIVRIPTHMGRLFIPQQVFSPFAALGNTYKIRIQVRTNDNNNRAYSNYRELKLPKELK